MDILSQYEKDHPEIPKEQKQPQMTDAYGHEYAGMIAFVMRMSGGSIRDKNRARGVLLAFAGIAAAISFFLFLYRPSGTLQPREKAFLNQGKSTESYDTTLFPR